MIIKATPITLSLSLLGHGCSRVSRPKCYDHWPGPFTIRHILLYFGRKTSKIPCRLNVIILFLNGNLNQRTNGPENAHLISGPSISTKDTKPRLTWLRKPLPSLLIILHLLIQFTILNKFKVTGYNNFQRIHHWHIFPYKSLKCKI